MRLRQHGRVLCVSLFAIWTCGFTTAQVVGPNVNVTRAAGNQYETTVAINPNDSRQIFVAARNEAAGLYTTRSMDGGVTWTSKLIGRTNTPAAGDIPRAAGDPSAAWDGFGNLFLAYLAQGSVSAATYVTLCMSQDGGATFYSPYGGGPAWVLPVNPPGTPISGDQPTVAVGPGSGGFAGSVWLTYWTLGGIVVSGAAVSGPGAVGLFASWQPQQPPSVNFGDLAVGPAGEVIVTYGPNSGTSGAVYANVKMDGLGPGPFSAPSMIVAVNMGGFTRIPAQPNWGVDPEPGLAWDRSGGAHRGRIYLLYTDTPSVGSADTNIFVLHSDDAGKTWSNPVRVNDDAGQNSQFLPRIALDQSNGAITVTWYDARESALNNTARLYGAFSSDGCATFGPNFPISAGVSDQSKSQAALKDSDYGDYTGNAFLNGRLVPAWADNSNSTGDNPEGATSFDVYVAVVEAPAARPHILSGGVISARAFGALKGIAPGTWIEIYGTDLAPAARDWTLSDFNGLNAPAQLGSVQVTVNGKLAVISHVVPGQVNAQVPDDIGAGPATVVVTNHGLSSDAATAAASAILPGLLAPPPFNVGGRQYAVALATDGLTFAGVPDGFPGGRPATPGEVLTFYGIGFGPVSPPVSAGTVTTTANRLQLPFSALFDQTAVDLSTPNTYTGLAPGAVGLYQFHLVVPNVADGVHQLRMAVGGQELTQALFIATKAR